MPLAQPLTDKQRDERIAFLAHSQEVMHERLSLVEQQIAETSLHWRRLDDRITEEGTKLDRVLAELKANTSATRETRDMLAAWRAVRGTGKVMGWLGKGLLWLSATIGAGAALWALFTGRVPPG